MLKNYLDTSPETRPGAPTDNGWYVADIGTLHHDGLHFRVVSILYAHGPSAYGVQGDYPHTGITCGQRADIMRHAPLRLEHLGGSGVEDLEFIWQTYVEADPATLTPGALELGKKTRAAVMACVARSTYPGCGHPADPPLDGSRDTGPCPWCETQRMMLEEQERADKAEAKLNKLYIRTEAVLRAAGITPGIVKTLLTIESDET